MFACFSRRWPASAVKWLGFSCLPALWLARQAAALHSSSCWRNNSKTQWHQICPVSRSVRQRNFKIKAPDTGHTQYGQKYVDSWTMRPYVIVMSVFPADVEPAAGIWGLAHSQSKLGQAFVYGAALWTLSCRNRKETNAQSWNNTNV